RPDPLPTRRSSAARRDRMAFDLRCQRMLEMHWESLFPPAPRRLRPVDRRSSRRMPMLLTAGATLIVLAVLSSQTSSQPADAKPAAKEAETACPPDAVALSPGMSIQAAVEKARPGASFCIKAGVHRLQFVAPKAGQKFFGEPGSVLNGARVLTRFERDGDTWVAPAQTQIGIKHGACDKTHP